MSSRRSGGTTAWAVRLMTDDLVHVLITVGACMVLLVLIFTRAGT
jgi:hypothetical protein